MWQFGVPNAPCGVERWFDIVGTTFAYLFLMHRVELKEIDRTVIELYYFVFLMHRVELKDSIVSALI